MRAFDAVVVGSGFGGAVVACRLAERGRSVLVLERGRRWAREDFPRPGRPDAPWRFHAGAPGLFELRSFPGMKVAVAAGVGGGSLVYTNVQKVPPASAFSGWPEPLTLDYLRPYYERVRGMLEPASIPHDLERLRAFDAAHRAIGRPEVERPPLAVRWGEGDDERPNRFGALQKPCNLCGVCVFGCDRHAKNTLDLTYLKRAESLGAEIRPLCQVTRIEPRGAGYEIGYVKSGDEYGGEKQGGKEAGRQGSNKVAARAVFLAAGSLGTTELVLRAREVDRTLPNVSPRLGANWSANGDFFAGLLDARRAIRPTLGPSVAGGYDASDSEGFYVLEGSIPPSVVAGRGSLVALAGKLASLFRLSFLRRRDPIAEPSHRCADEEAEELLRHMGVFFPMGRDAADGRLRLDADGRLDLDWDPRASEELLSRMRRYLEELGGGYGGWMAVPRGWWGKVPGTVHPLGGCGLGRQPSEGVCDPYGRVFGHANLYVCDGSLFPRALGVPPSMTIAALAEHVVDHLAAAD